MENEEPKKKRRRFAPTKAEPLGFTKKGTPRLRRSPDQVKKGFEVKKLPPHTRREKPDNYLKYHRLVMAWARKRYKISTAHLEMIFFLYDEDIFNQTKIKEYARILPFDRNKVARLIDEGWLRTWPDSRDRRYKLYELTHLGKSIYNEVRNRLEGHTKISEFAENNALIQNTNSKHFMYKVTIKKMNKELDKREKEKRHPGRTDYKAVKIQKEP
jgi:DNA-binding MarR family transcriptional regulator